MLLSFLTIELVNYPFLDIRSLIKDTNYQIAIYPGSVHEELFRDSPNEFARMAWKSRIEPNLDNYKIYMTKNEITDVLNHGWYIALFYSKDNVM